jgi:hypothetical protein
MCLKQELATTAELVNEVLKRKQLKDEELFCDKERVVKKAKQTEQPYVLCFS